LGRYPRGTFPMVKGCGGKGNIFVYVLNDYLSLVAYCDSETGGGGSPSVDLSLKGHATGVQCRCFDG
jgi:hypothetical protein